MPQLYSFATNLRIMHLGRLCRPGVFRYADSVRSSFVFRIVVVLSISPHTLVTPKVVARAHVKPMFGRVPITIVVSHTSVLTYARTGVEPQLLTDNKQCVLRRIKDTCAFSYWGFLAPKSSCAANGGREKLNARSVNSSGRREDTRVNLSLYKRQFEDEWQQSYAYKTVVSSVDSSSTWSGHHL